jgi:hypothetical protein
MFTVPCLVCLKPATGGPCCSDACRDALAYMNTAATVSRAGANALQVHILAYNAHTEALRTGLWN